MTKKRRVFDVDLPDEVTDGGQGFEVARKGPMATAIGENAGSLRQRQEIEADVRAENDALAHEFVRLKKLGLITDLIHVDAISSTKLTRDRSSGADLELDELKTSILAIGLSNPIQVEQVGEGRYELVQGYRRLAAYRALADETGQERFRRIPAALIARGETIEGLYRRMVDENLVRQDISWSEMASLARSYAADRVMGCSDIDDAVNRLYASVGAQKRSYIRRFAILLSRTGHLLRHPTAIPRAVGLSAAFRVENDPASVSELATHLAAVPTRGAAEEVAILRSFGEVQVARETRGGAPSRGRPAKRGKTILRLPLSGGEVKCSASPGRVEIQADYDFAAVEPLRLEAAVEAFFAAVWQVP